MHCKLKNGSPISMGIEAMYANTIQTTEFNLEPCRLLEPLIRFCLERHIVLPHNSGKTAHVGDNHAALTIRINTTECLYPPPSRN